MRDLGLATPAQWARRVSLMEHHRVSAREAKKQLESLALDLALVVVKIEGQAEPCYLPAEDYVLLDVLERGDVPAQWKPLAATTNEEVTFLAPLDNAIWDRARLQSLFDFEYVWEVYKPAHTRKWGYYTLPILYGDQLVARIAPRLDRKTRTLNVEGFWLESDTLAADGAFISALAAGLTRFARFHQAERLDFAACANVTPALRVMLDKIASIL